MSVVSSEDTARMAESYRAKSHRTPKRLTCGKSAARVVANLLHSPSLLSILLGVAYSLVFKVTPGDTSSNKNIPLFIDKALILGGQPYSMTALFGGGICQLLEN